MKVLILDKSPIFRMGLKQIMAQMEKKTENKIEVYESDNISEGVNIAESVNLDIILIDVNIDNIENVNVDNRIENKTVSIIEKFKRDKPIRNLYESGQVHSPDVIFLCDKKGYVKYDELNRLGVSGIVMKNINEKDLIYVLSVVMKGEKYYSPECLEVFLPERENLTKRENEVLELLKEGKSNYEIGKELFISEATTKKHVSSILGKMGLKNRVEVVIAVNNKYRM